MIHTADEAYLALGDYRNGARSWRAGQFVLITEPELLPVLAADGGLDLLQRLDRAAFLGKAGAPAKRGPEPAPAASEAEPAAEEPAVAEPESEPAQGVTSAGGKARGSNRMRTGAATR